MSENNVKRLHLIYGIALSVLLCVVGILAIAMCVQIYKSGSSPFTRESVAQHFAKIAVFVYALIAFVIGGAIINLVFPMPEARLKGTPNDGVTLYRLYERMGTPSMDGAVKIEKERTTRLVLFSVSLFLVFAAAIASAIHVVSGYDASDININSQVIKATLTLLRYFTLPTAYAIATVYLCRSSIKRELAVVKAELSSKKAENVSDFEQSNGADAPVNITFTAVTTDIANAGRKSYKKSKIRDLVSVIATLSLIIVSIVFIILGASNGGMADVVTKAINICTECIGMG